MIVLFTDFGLRGPYVGQMKARILAAAPDVPVVDLLHDAPVMDPRASSYLVEPFVRQLPSGSVVLAVVDPGVGTGERDGAVLYADGRWFVGPDNGLFEFVQRRAAMVRRWRLPDPDARVSPTFHGRDVFAQVAASLYLNGAAGNWDERPGPRFDWGDDTPFVLYIDEYGNAITGIRGEMLADSAVLEVAEQPLHHGPTFGRVPVGSGFWYRNSSGLVEVAVNQGSAAAVFGLARGSRVRLVRT